MSEERKKVRTDFTQGNMGPLFIKFVIPFLLANILNSVYNAVDMIIIGRYVGATGTAAVATGGKLLTAFTSFCMGLAGGGQIYISQLLGGGQREKVNRAIGTLFSVLGIISVILTLSVCGLSKNIITWLNVKPEYYDGALSYLVITAIGFPLMFGYNSISSVLRGMGDSKHPLLFIAIAAFSNLILDIVFVAGFGMGEKGVALATVMGQGISLLLEIRLLYKNRQEFGFDFKPTSFLIEKDAAKIMLRLGIPVAARNLLVTGMQVVMAGFVNKFGTVDTAAFGIGTKLTSFATIVSSSCTQAGGAVVAQNLGAEKPERVKKLMGIMLSLTEGFAVLAAIVALLWPNAIFGLFTTEAAVMVFAKPITRMVIITLFLAGLSSGFASVAVGSGAAGLSLLAGIMDGVVFRVSLSFLFGYYFKMGMLGFFLGDVLARVAYVAVNGAYYFSGKWKTRKLIK